MFGDVFTDELDADVLGWFGLNRATQNRPAAAIEPGSFSGGESDVAREVTAAIDGHGLPFMRLASTLQALCRHLDEGLGINQHSRIAVRWRSSWRVTRGRAHEDLEETLTKLGDRDDLAAQEVRRFAEVMRSRLEERL